MAATCPLFAAVLSAVSPPFFLALTSQPASSIFSIDSTSPILAIAMSGVVSSATLEAPQPMVQLARMEVQRCRNYGNERFRSEK